MPNSCFCQCHWKASVSITSSSYLSRLRSQHLILTLQGLVLGVLLLLLLFYVCLWLYFEFNSVYVFMVHQIHKPAFLLRELLSVKDNLIFLVVSRTLKVPATIFHLKTQFKQSARVSFCMVKKKKESPTKFKEIQSL